MSAFLCSLASQHTTVTINIEHSCDRGSPSLILGSAGVVASVVLPHRGDDQHAAPAADGRGHNAGISGCPGVAVEGPGDGHGLIPLHGNAGQLGKVSLVNNLSAKCQGDKLGCH